MRGLPGLCTLLLALSPALSQDKLSVSLDEVDAKPTLRSFARAQEESALVGCAVIWMTDSNDFPSDGRLELACIAEGSFTRRSLGKSAETLRDLRVETGPERALRVILAHESFIEERMIRDRSAELSSPRVLLEGQGFTRGALRSRPDFDADGTKDLQLDTWRGVEAWRRGPEGYERLSAARLPPRASMSRFGPDMTISGWDITSGEEPVTRWTSPETRQGKRLSTWRIPLEEGVFGQPCEAWVQTPEPMNAQTRRFAVLEDRELLIAITQPAESFSLFGEGALVIARPVCDETRRGKPPLLVAKTSYAPWFPPTIREVEDVTGDGLEDVVLVGYSGKLSVSAEVRLHEGLPGGGFSARAVKWEEDADAGGLTWDADLDGDGFEDLVLDDSGTLEVYRGVAPRKGRVPLETRPSWRARLPRKWNADWMATWPIDAENRHVVVAWLSHEDDERRAFGIIEIPLSND